MQVNEASPNAELEKKSKIPRQDAGATETSCDKILSIGKTQSAATRLLLFSVYEGFSKCFTLVSRLMAPSANQIKFTAPRGKPSLSISSSSPPPPGTAFKTFPILPRFLRFFSGYFKFFEQIF